MPRLRTAPTLLLATALAAPAPADQFPIAIDGLFDDWQAVPAAHTDPSGDGGSGADLGGLFIADDPEFLFMRIELGVAMSFSDGNGLVIYLDTDDDASTGAPVGGIGAELEWRPGDRQGTYHGGGGETVFHEDVLFRGGPQVTGDVFEVAFGRDAEPDGGTPLFAGATVRVLIRDDGGGDQLPDGDGGVAYTLDEGPPAPPATPIELDRDDPGDLRIVTWNVLQDSPWDPDLEDAFRRQLQAVSPDVVNFQEVYDHDANETRDLVASWLGGSWFAADVSDTVTVSRYALLETWALSGNLAARLHTTAAIGTELVIVNAHLPCCTNDAGRQDEADEIMAFLRDEVAGSLPVVITGDLNLVGLRQQLTTLLTGDIVDESSWGPDFDPDPDGTELANLISRQTEKRMGYTWRNDASSFWPGHLDYFIYTDSALEARKSYCVYTPEMSPSALAEHGLLAGDSLASDHLLVTLDLRPADAACAADLDADGTVGITDLLALLAAWGPNPGHPADLDGDADVGITDLLALLAAWGPCP